MESIYEHPGGEKPEQKNFKRSGNIHLEYLKVNRRFISPNFGRPHKDVTTEDIKEKACKIFKKSRLKRNAQM